MKIYLVGGAVRDKILNLSVKERDWVVVGATTQEMIDQGYRQVGKEFPVFLHPKTHEEYALARKERKTQPGYKGFTFDTSTHVSLIEDLQRRDLTMNAMAENDKGELIDPYHGKQDIENKILRHVSPAFIEDPVRILRVGRFLARYAQFEFTVATDTLQLMRSMVEAGEVDALTPERVWKELDRALMEANPEKFFEVLASCHALIKLFPGLDIEGAGISALKTATQLKFSSTIRFAVLFYDLKNAKSSITQLCSRYRVPNEYKELAILVAQYYQTALETKNLSAEAILDLFYTLDIFRREKRSMNFIQACEAIASSKQIDFDAAWLINLIQQTKSIDVQILITKGYQGNELAAALKKQRLEKMIEQLKKV